MCNTEDCLHYDYVRLAWDIGFTFEEYDVKNGFDISVIGLVDVEKVAKDRDIPTVVKHIPTLLNFRLDNDMGKVLEPNFIKLFRLSQLAIQYLIFCKKYLDSTVALIKSELISLSDDKTDIELYLEELKAENEAIRRKYDELKATLSTSIYKCEECSKTFYSEEYLLAHIRRRHQVHNAQMQTEADKLQLEIKELKQRLNNTERLILKEELKDYEKEDEGDKVSLKEREAEKEKELASVEPNNDDVLENSIQFKFQQLKNHIETEINSLKNEEFYAGICEKYLKERVAKNLSVTTIQTNASDVQIHGNATQNSHTSIQTETKPERKDVAIEVDDRDLEGANISAQSPTVDSKHNKAVESYTQTDCKTVSEGTSMSPQPTPRKSLKSNDIGTSHSGDSDHSAASSPLKEPSSKRSSVNVTSLGSVDSAGKESNPNVMKSIEEKLAKEVEHQRETLEHILDLKLSGSLNKMEAQMTAFWQKLNAWESNLTYAKSNSVISMNTHSAPIDNDKNNEVVVKRQNSVGSIASNSPIHRKPVHEVKRVEPRQPTQVVPKALPRSFNAPKSPVKVVPKVVEQINHTKNDLSKFLDSSDEDETQGSKTSASKSEQTADNLTSEEETPCNMKPTESFKKRLDETLMHRLKPVTTVQAVHRKDVEEKPHAVQRPPERANLERKSTIPEIAASKISKLLPIRRSNSKNSEHSASEANAENTENTENSGGDYKDMRSRIKRHVEETVSKKLKDIGVSPHWKCLPDKSYNKAIEIVEHQANLSKKNIHDFHKIRKNIERAIDKEIDKSTEGKKRRTTINLPINNKVIDGYDRTASSTADSYVPSESSVEIPLQRVSGRPLIKENSRRNSIQTESTTPSPIKVMHKNVHHQQQNENKAEIVNMATVTPFKQSKNDTPATASTPGATIAIAEVHTQNQKKKVLFNLESDTEQSEQQSPVKLPQAHQVHQKDLSAFMDQEKSKLKSEATQKQKKTGHLELHTGSESSDWDISDIT